MKTLKDLTSENLNSFMIWYKENFKVNSDLFCKIHKKEEFINYCLAEFLRW